MSTPKILKIKIKFPRSLIIINYDVSTAVQKKTWPNFNCFTQKDLKFLLTQEVYFSHKWQFAHPTSNLLIVKY